MKWSKIKKARTFDDDLIIRGELREIVEAATDDLAHKLDISYDTAKEVQGAVEDWLHNRPHINLGRD